MRAKTDLFIILLAVCLLATGALWLRTQFRLDHLASSSDGATTFLLYTGPGKLRVVWGEYWSDAVPDDGWEYSSYIASSIASRDDSPGFRLERVQRSGPYVSEDTTVVGVPIWSLVAPQLLLLMLMLRARRRSNDEVGARGYSVVMNEEPLKSATDE